MASDIRHDIARMRQHGQRVIWQFIDAPNVIKRPPAAEGVEFSPEVDPALIYWDHFISIGPIALGVRSVSSGLLQFPTYQHAERWLDEQQHTWVEQDPLPPAAPGFYERWSGARFTCANCGVWGANGEWERSHAV